MLLKNEYLVAIIAGDTAENEHLQNLTLFIHLFELGSLVEAALRGAVDQAVYQLSIQLCGELCFWLLEGDHSTSRYF